MSLITKLNKFKNKKPMIFKIHYKLKIPLKLCQTEKLGEVEGKEKENAENMHRERKGKK